MHNNCYVLLCRKKLYYYITPKYQTSFLSNYAKILVSTMDFDERDEL